MTGCTTSPVFATQSGSSLTINSVVNTKPTYEDAIVIRPASSGVQTEFRINTGGTFVLNGARINVSGLGSNDYQSIFFNKGSTITITNGWLKSSKNQARWGESGAGNMLSMNINGLIAEKIFTTIFGTFGSLNGLAPLNSVTQTVAYGAFVSFTLRDYAPLDTGSFLDNYDIVNLFAVNSLGSGLDIRSGQGPGKWISLQKEFTLSTLTAAGASISGAVVYVKDTNNGGRVNIPAIPNQLSDNVYINSTSGAGITPTVSLYVLHAQAQNPYQSVPIRDYRTKTTTAGADLFDVYTWAYDYGFDSLNNAAMKGTGVLAISRTLFADAGVTLTEANAVAKLASSFTVAGNTLTETAASTLDDLYDAMKAYKTRPIQAQLEYPTISTQPVTASGKTLVTAMALVVNAALTAGSKFDSIAISATLSGTLTAGGPYTFTGGTLNAPVSAPTLTGGTINIGAAGTYGFATDAGTTIVSMTPTAPGTYPLNGPHSATLDLRNAAAHAVTVQLPTGTSFTTASNVGGVITVVNPPITLQFLRPNIINGSNYVIRNSTTATEAASGTTSGGTGINVTLTSGTHYSAADVLELKIGYCVGVSARLVITEQATAPAITAINSAPTAQVVNDVYASLAINGSTRTEFSADYVNDEVDIVVAADFYGQNFMAWWVYNESTLDGLRNFVGLYTLIDEGNIRNNTAVGIALFDNTTATNIKQIDNARIFRSDGGYPVKQPSTGGGSIDINWRNAVQTIAVGSAVLPSDVTAISAATIAALNATTIPVNMEKVRGQNLTGNGSSVPWGPA
jgi:hypothetical protein